MNQDIQETVDTFNVNRRSFLKLCGTATIATFALGMVPEAKGAELTELPKRGRMLNYKRGRKTPSICPYCAGGCGLIVTSLEGSSSDMREGDIYAKNLERDLSARGKIIEIEGDSYHPINEGALCSKPSALLQFVNSDRRVLYPMKRTNPKKGENEDLARIRDRGEKRGLRNRKDRKGSRGGAVMKCIVTERFQPLTVNNKIIHEVAMP